MSLINSAPVLCIALAPQQVSFALRQGQRFVADSSWHQACDNPDGSWQNAIMLLRSGLQQAKAFANGTPVHISLATRWCPMLRLPWSDAMLAAESNQRFLHNQFIAMYGEAAREWQIAVDDAPYGRPRLACGLDRALLQALQELSADFSLQLAQVEPLLAQAWRSVVRVYGKHTAAFALIEADRISLAPSFGGHIVQVHSEYWQANLHWSQALKQIWLRFCLREPSMSELSRVAVLNVAGLTLRGDLSPPFQLMQMASPELAPSFAALICNR